MERRIRVTGKGKLSVKPDMIRLFIDLSDTKPTYEQTLEQSALQVEVLKDCLEKIGFKRSDLKTLDFNVDTEYRRVRDKKDDWKKEFVGYKFEHNLKLEIDVDNSRLGQVLYALAHASVRPELRICYTIKNPDAAKTQLLGNAVADSKEKAKVLTQAADVKLGDIVSIDYSWGEIEFVSEPMKRFLSVEEDCCLSDEPAGYDIDIEADDIDLSDTVTVVWQIL